MRTIKEKKKFIVFGQFDTVSDVEIVSVEAETHEEALHWAEIRNDLGSFVVCDENQARKIAN